MLDVGRCGIIRILVDHPEPLNLGIRRRDGDGAAQTYLALRMYGECVGVTDVGKSFRHVSLRGFSVVFTRNSKPLPALAKV